MQGVCFFLFILQEEVALHQKVGDRIVCMYMWRALLNFVEHAVGLQACWSNITGGHADKLGRNMSVDTASERERGQKWCALYVCYVCQCKWVSVCILSK